VAEAIPAGRRQRTVSAVSLSGIHARSRSFEKRMQVVEPDQVDILAFAVPRCFQQIGDAEEAGFPRELRRDFRKLDGLDGVDFDLAFVHTVPRADGYAGTTPNPNAGGNFAATDSFAQTFCEDHAESLHPVGWIDDAADPTDRDLR
jgi:hypothetical protein